MSNQIIINQQHQNLNVVKLDVFAPKNTDEERHNMARKLALVCHYLNTRVRVGAHFFNGGVTNKSYVDPGCDPNDVDFDDPTIYLRINDDYLLNSEDDLSKTAFGLMSSFMNDDEIRNCAHRLIDMIRGQAPGMNYLNIIQ